MTTIAPIENPRTTEFKQQASHLKSLLKGRKPDVSQGECLDILSKVLGRKKGWNQMSAELKSQVAPEEIERQQTAFFNGVLLPGLAGLAKTAGLDFPLSSQLFSTENRAGKQQNLTLRHAGGSPGCCIAGDLRLTARDIDWRSLSLDLFFPQTAFTVATKLLTSEVMGDDQTPQLTRCFNRTPDEAYCLSLEVFRAGSCARSGYYIWDDQERVEEFFQDAGKTMTDLAPILNAFSRLKGSWGDTRLFRKVEDAIWTAFEGTPRYHAKSTCFHTLRIGEVELSAEAGQFGPYIMGPKGSVEIGAGEIVFLEEPSTDTGPRGMIQGFCIAKYGSHSQPRISLAGLSVSDIHRVIAEFGVQPCFSVLDRLGISRDRESLARFHDQMFYDTPAFQGLVGWVKKHPQFAKDLDTGEAHHLPEWYKQARKELQLSRQNTGR